MKLRRKALKKNKKGAFVGAWMPKELVKAIDQAAARLDLDRAKFLRKATKEKFNRKIS